ncbi:MAG: response regulator, partial [Thermomicrobiales bacterium]
PIADPNEIQATASRMLGEHLGVNRVLYAEIVHEREAVVNRDWVNGVPSVVGRYSTLSFGQSNVAKARASATLVCGNVAKDPTLNEHNRKAYESLDIASYIGVSLVKENRWVAGFAVQNAIPRTWTETEIKLTEETAERTWAAVERAQAEAAVRASEDRLARANAELELRVAERTRQLEQEMKRREVTQAALSQAQRLEAVGQLAGGIAHDFNNLLAVVSGSLELAESHIVDAGARRLVERAVEAVRMGASLTRRLLSFAGRRRYEPVPLSLNERVNRILTLLNRTLGEQIEVSCQLASDLWLTMADPGEIDNVILNLSINARDAMPNGGKLDIATRNVTLDPSAAAAMTDACPGDFVVIGVTDTGHGMTSQTMQRAVEPFFTTKQGKGTGLGLSIVYGYAKQTGGFMSLSSELGKGSSIEVYLPRATQPNTLADAPSQREEIPMGDGELILLVEDSEQVRYVCSAQLESLGYAVIETKDGPEALKQLQEEYPFELVLSDISMPGGMNGYDVAKWVMNAKPELGILLMSGHDKSDVAICEAFERVPLLHKPFTKKQLALAVHNALRARHY